MELKESIYTDHNGRKCLLDNRQMRYTDDTGKPLFENTIMANEKTLRDWFAGQAVIGVLSGMSERLSLGLSNEDNNNAVAIVAGAIADAMLEERNK